MEAVKLQKKKINKGKLKRTIKNVLCRPDRTDWPTVSEEQEKELEILLNKYKVNIPEFKKPHWKELKSIPKEERPGPPKIEKPNGLLFGITETSDSVAKTECSAVLIEASVNPRTIVQSVLEACIDAKVPAVCLNGLRKLCASYFGIPTSCLGIKQGSMTEISTKICEWRKDQPVQTEQHEIKDVEMHQSTKSKEPQPMDTQECLFLYRTSKKYRVFVPPLPPSDEKLSNAKKEFVGQDFIAFTQESGPTRKSFMKMVVKRVSNNPDRTRKSK